MCQGEDPLCSRAVRKAELVSSVSTRSCSLASPTPHSHHQEHPLPCPKAVAAEAAPLRLVPSSPLSLQSPSHSGSQSQSQSQSKPQSEPQSHLQSQSQLQLQPQSQSQSLGSQDLQNPSLSWQETLGILEADFPASLGALRTTVASTPRPGSVNAQGKRQGQAQGKVDSSQHQVGLQAIRYKMEETSGAAGGGPMALSLENILEAMSSHTDKHPLLSDRHPSFSDRPPSSSDKHPSYSNKHEPVAGAPFQGLSGNPPAVPHAASMGLSAQEEHTWIQAALEDMERPSNAVQLASAAAGAGPGVELGFAKFLGSRDVSVTASLTPPAVHHKSLWLGKRPPGGPAQEGGEKTPLIPGPEQSVLAHSTDDKERTLMTPGLGQPQGGRRVATQGTPVLPGAASALLWPGPLPTVSPGYTGNEAGPAVGALSQEPIKRARMDRDGDRNTASGGLLVQNSIGEARNESKGFGLPQAPARALSSTSGGMGAVALHRVDMPGASRWQIGGPSLIQAKGQCQDLTGRAQGRGQAHSLARLSSKAAPDQSATPSLPSSTRLYDLPGTGFRPCQEVQDARDPQDVRDVFGIRAGEFGSPMAISKSLTAALAHYDASPGLGAEAQWEGQGQGQGQTQEQGQGQGQGNEQGYWVKSTSGVNPRSISAPTTSRGRAHPQLLQHLEEHWAQAQGLVQLERQLRARAQQPRHALAAGAPPPRLTSCSGSAQCNLSPTGDVVLSSPMGVSSAVALGTCDFNASAVGSGSGAGTPKAGQAQAQLQGQGPGQAQLNSGNPAEGGGTPGAARGVASVGRLLQVMDLLQSRMDALRAILGKLQEGEGTESEAQARSRWEAATMSVATLVQQLAVSAASILPSHLRLNLLVPMLRERHLAQGQLSQAGSPTVGAGLVQQQRGSQEGDGLLLPDQRQRGGEEGSGAEGGMSEEGLGIKDTLRRSPLAPLSPLSPLSQRTTGALGTPSAHHLAALQAMLPPLAGRTDAAAAAAAAGAAPAVAVAPAPAAAPALGGETAGGRIGGPATGTVGASTGAAASGGVTGVAQGPSSVLGDRLSDIFFGLDHTDTAGHTDPVGATATHQSILQQGLVQQGFTLQGIAQQGTTHQRATQQGLTVQGMGRRTPPGLEVQQRPMQEGATQQGISQAAHSQQGGAPAVHSSQQPSPRALFSELDAFGTLQAGASKEEDVVVSFQEDPSDSASVDVEPNPTPGAGEGMEGRGRRRQGLPSRLGTGPGALAGGVLEGAPGMGEEGSAEAGEGEGLGEGERDGGGEGRGEGEGEAQSEGGPLVVVELDVEELLAEHSMFCPVCDKGFKREANLKIHMRGHGNAYKAAVGLGLLDGADAEAKRQERKRRRYSCPVAGCRRNQGHADFQALKTLVCVKNHYKRTHGPKPFCCSKCGGKSFAVLADLKTHEKHCGKIPQWACSCGNTFSRKDKLSRHIELFQGHTALGLLLETDAPGPAAAGLVKTEAGVAGDGRTEG